MTDNTFCATGPGGGVDPSCGRGNGKDIEEEPREADVEAREKEKEKKVVKAIGKQLKATQKGKEPGEAHVWTKGKKPKPAKGR